MYVVPYSHLSYTEAFIKLLSFLFSFSCITLLGFTQLFDVSDLLNLENHYDHISLHRGICVVLGFLSGSLVFEVSSFVFCVLGATGLSFPGAKATGIFPGFSVLA